MTQPNRMRLPVPPVFAGEAVSWGLASGKGALVARVVWGQSMGGERSSELRCDRQASCFPGAECAALGKRSWAGPGRLFELQQERFGEEHAHAREIEPGSGAGTADKGDGAAHTELPIQVA